MFPLQRLVPFPFVETFISIKFHVCDQRVVFDWMVFYTIANVTYKFLSSVGLGPYMYSQTCVKQPPKGNTKSGCLGQVAA